MTNEQLAILLTNQRRLLAAAINTADALMPEGSARARVYIGPGLCLFCKHPEHWDENGGRAVALEPFGELLNLLNEQIAVLTKHKP